MLDITARTFYKVKVGDRHFFEEGSDKYTRFTPEQLDEIRKIKISSILCSNLDLNHAPVNGFLDASVVVNVNQPCDNHYQLNLNHWSTVAN